MGLVPAGAHGTALGARTAWGPHLPRASCRRGCQGAARTERLLAHHGAARLCFSSPHPAPVAEDCSPTSLPAFLAPLAPPHTRRFLGDSLDARLLSRCAPASLQMRANAVFAPILRLAWLLILNMVPGARGLALASVVPRVSKTYIAYFQQPRGHPPFIDPPRSTTPLDQPPPETCACPLLPRVPGLVCRACFFSCTGLRLSS